MIDTVQQFDLYTDWKQTVDNLKPIIAIIQNDFNRLSCDGYLTKEQLADNILEFNKIFEDRVKDLFDKKQEIDKFLLNVLEEL